MTVQEITQSRLPGAELVAKGLEDLAQHQLTQEALLVLIAAPRLGSLGVAVPERPDVPRPREHALYALLESTHGKGAHSQYNAVLGRMASFCRALERERGARLRMSPGSTQESSES